MAKEVWCELYIDGRMSFKRLASHVLSIVDGTISFTDKRSCWYIKSEFASIDVEINENRPVPNMAEDAQFLLRPFLVSAGENPGALEGGFEQVIRKLVLELRKQGLQVDLIADFEVE